MVCLYHITPPVWYWGMLRLWHCSTHCLRCSLCCALPSLNCQTEGPIAQWPLDPCTENALSLLRGERNASSRWSNSFICCIQIYPDVGVSSSSWGYPLHGWFISRKSQSNSWMMTGCTPLWKPPDVMWWNPHTGYHFVGPPFEIRLSVPQVDWPHGDFFEAEADSNRGFSRFRIGETGTWGYVFVYHWIFHKCVFLYVYI